MYVYTNRRVFDWNRQEQFARASGDRNPIHMDPIAARRTHAGTRIVHGVHAVLWALDCFAQTELYAPHIKSVKAQFPRPIYIDDEVLIQIARPTPDTVRALLLVGGEQVVEIAINFDATGGSALPSNIASDAASAMQPVLPVERSVDDMEHLAGLLSFSPNVSELGAMFPAANRALGLATLASLASTSYLVGMVVPGLHSMFSGLDISLSQIPVAITDALEFRVLAVNRRFRLARIGIRGPGLYGILEAINRLPPVKQLSMELARTLVVPNEFRGATVLVIGGSRGLGEVSAKLLAAGGSAVVITYTKGASDASAVVDEIVDVGARCEAIPYDIHRAPLDQIAQMSVAPTHVYYFATPPISLRKRQLFDVTRFTEFNAFYLSGFSALVQACASIRNDGVKFFYPSSSFVETRPKSMTEYTMSKAAGEILCADMMRIIPGVKIVTHRLPRLPTDQTSSVVQSVTADPVAVMLPLIREMQARV